LEDKELVDRIRNGNHHAFTVLIRNTERLVAQIVFKMIGNAEDRRDIAQDVYLKAYKNISRFQFKSKLSTWIAQIAYNTCLNHLEKKKLVFIENEQRENEAPQSTLEDLADHSADLNDNETLKHIFSSQRSELLKQAVNKLPAVYQTLITLFHYEELSYEEIAQITGLPDGTVKNYLFRARKSLKDEILLRYKKEDL
jgi:RNA polymerase sigma factor (sigma-70 family)